MNIKKTAIALAWIAMVVLTGCGYMDEKPLVINHLGQAGVADVLTNADSQQDEVKSSDASNNSSEKSDDTFERSIQDVNRYPDNADISLKNPVYFLYDSSEVEPEFLPLIEKYSQDLLDHADHSVILEGHADERGSREYNIALGEERAKAVAKMMQARGISFNQLEIVSYGEEKPSSHEHNETAWHLNRLVNLISQRSQK